MIDIFGPETPCLMRLLADISVMTQNDVDAVAGAWSKASGDERAVAWAAVERRADDDKRLEIHHAARVARQHALTVTRSRGRRETAFAAAAWDAAGAVSSGAADWAYHLLCAPMATRLTWLTEQRAPSVPAQRSPIESETWDERALSPRSGGRR